MRRGTRLVPVLALATAACAYYNGMYNAKRLARQAERSERAGRAAEAAGRWREVVVHADTLLSRHPGSRWADDAQLLRGRAYVALGGWHDAVSSLESAVRVAGAEQQRVEARFWLGLAYAGAGRHQDALGSLDSALQARAAALRSRAQLARGRALLALERPAEALRAFLESGEPEAPFERARAAVATGDLGTATAWTDSAAAARLAREDDWRPLLDSLAAAGGSEAAGRITLVLVARPDIGPGAGARLLLADGDRWMTAGSDSLAVERWTEARRMAPDSAEGRLAAVRLLLRQARMAATLEQGEEVRSGLAAVVAAGGEPARLAEDALRHLSPGDTASAVDAPDALAFQRGQVLRDSMGARGLAAAVFADMAERFPGSPWAPKAIAAAISAGHPRADSLRVVLLGRYASSPYARIAGGRSVDQTEYAALEDSLQRALDALAGETQAPHPVEEDILEPRRVRPGPPGQRPATPRPQGATPRPPPQGPLRVEP